MSSRVPPGLKLRATLTRTRQFVGLLEREVEVEVAAAGVAVGDAGEAVLVVEARTASSPRAAFLLGGRRCRPPPGTPLSTP